MFGATAQIITGEYGGRTSISNASGYFAFPGVLGEMTIRIEREGYDHSVATLNVTGNVALDVKLFSLVLSDTLQLGKAIRSEVLSSAPPCDPVRWDAAAPCKTFHFRASTNGILVITISWEFLPELDATMVTRNDAYVATSIPAGEFALALAGPVVAGVIYEIRVNAYYGGQAFTLRADLNAASAQAKTPPISLRR